MRSKLPFLKEEPLIQMVTTTSVFQAFTMNKNTTFWKHGNTKRCLCVSSAIVVPITLIGLGILLEYALRTVSTNTPSIIQKKLLAKAKTFLIFYDSTILANSMRFQKKREYSSERCLHVTVYLLPWKRMTRMQ